MLNEQAKSAEVINLHDVREAPDLDRSFLYTEIGRVSSYDTLMEPDFSEVPDNISFTPNASFEKYMKMHKVMLGEKGAEQLKEIHEALKSECMPRYLEAAGWAAVEAALIKEADSPEVRLDLLGAGEECWAQALKTQQKFNETGLRHVSEFSFPYKLALDMAVLPLFKDMVSGNVRQATVESVFYDCLNIAQANAVKIDLMLKQGDDDGLGEHVGLGYEANALLAFNSLKSPTWFAIPSIGRSDSGHHHQKQTHDLLVVNQRRGKILSMAPVEIKSTVGRREKERYDALLVRGKMHLSVEGRYRPEQTLEAITAQAEGRATAEDNQVVFAITNRFKNMVKDYYAGDEIVVSKRKRQTIFRDRALVTQRHPGLAVA